MERAIITDKLKLIEELIDIFKYPTVETIGKYNLNYPINELEVEYVSLFIANYDIKPISLYLSTYVDINTPDLLEKLTNIFKAANVEINKDFKERIDHIVIILEFFYLLMESEIEKRYLENFFKNYVQPFNKISEVLKSRTNNKFFLSGAEKLIQLCQGF